MTGGADQQSFGRPRVLHVVAEMGTGGAERVILHLARHGLGLAEVSVAGADGEWSPRLADHGAAFYPLPARSATAWRVQTVRRLRELIAAEQPDVVHVHNIRMSAFVRLATLGMKDLPYIFTTMHGVPPESEAMAVRVLRLAGWPVVNCAPQMVDVMASHGLPRSRQSVVINGGSMRRADDSEIVTFASTHDIGETPVVIGLGRLVEQKAWHRLVEAAASVPNAQVLIAGDGELRESLEALADELGSPVRFLGQVGDPAPLVGLADVMVFASNWEGLPIAALEALSVGLPVVSTKASRIADAVDSPAIITAEADTGPALAKAINELVENPDHLANLRLEALEASKELTTEKMAQRYQAIYKAAQTKPPATP